MDGGERAMITEMLMRLFGGVVATVLGWLPDWSLPGEAQSLIDDVFAEATGFASKLGTWVPMDQAVYAAAFVTAVTIAAGILFVVRLIASYMTLGGGAV